VDTDRLSPQIAWPGVLASPRQTTSPDSPCSHPRLVFLTDSLALYMVAEYRLVSANITRCYSEVNATRERQKARPLNHQLTRT
jgi:hypothetical protein